jgi:hypothetical protein
MVTAWVLNSHLICVLGRRILERPEFLAEQPGREEAPPDNRIGVRRASDLVAPIQTVLL